MGAPNIQPRNDVLNENICPVWRESLLAASTYAGRGYAHIEDMTANLPLQEIAQNVTTYFLEANKVVSEASHGYVDFAEGTHGAHAIEAIVFSYFGAKTCMSNIGSSIMKFIGVPTGAVVGGKIGYDYFCADYEKKMAHKQPPLNLKDAAKYAYQFEVVAIDVQRRFGEMLKKSDPEEFLQKLQN